jgi:hypothetical protein
MAFIPPIVSRVLTMSFEQKCQVLEALEEVLAYFPEAEILDALDDDQNSGRRYAPTIKTPRAGDVRRWRKAAGL